MRYQYKDERPRSKSVFWVKELVRFKALRDQILSTPICKKIITQMPFEVNWGFIDENPLITTDTSIRNGAPCITGTRINAELIQSLWYGGETVEALMNLYDLTEEQVRAAINYKESK